ncbi:pyridoxal-dependent decarboxylase [Enterobacter hormaechei]
MKPKIYRKSLFFNVNYLAVICQPFALNFCRPGGQIIAQYYNFLRLGREGYAKIHNACYHTAQYLAEKLKS